MEIKELLGLARKYAASVRENFPDFSEQKQASVTVIQTARNAVVAGVTGIGIEDGTAVVVDSVSQAVTALSGMQIATGLVTVGLSDDAVVEPSEKSISRLVLANAGNAACTVLVSEDEAKPASALTAVVADAVNDFMSGFDDAESAPAHEKAPTPATN